MDDYSDKSDDEINEMILRIKYGNWSPNIDYCADWKSAGALMEDSEICVIKSDRWNASNKLDTTLELINPQKLMHAASDNPRRAISIVFLMMNETKNG